MQLIPLKTSISNLYAEHMKTEDLNGFFQDISVLIHEGLKEQYGLQQMENSVTDYIRDLKDTKIQEQLGHLEEMIQRRINNTGETRKEACEHIINYLTNSGN